MPENDLSRQITTPVLTGIIKTLRDDKGFGFISRDGEDGDLFFHRNDLLQEWDTLQCGQEVTFELWTGERGYAARRVNQLGEPPELSDYHELPTTPPILITSLQECTTELVDYVTKHPAELRQLHPGTFENLVAEIFRNEGFDTERISKWNEPDGGVDLIAVRHLSLSVDIRLAIQCKRWAQQRGLSAEPIRSLGGVLDRFHAHAGVVATTGVFSEEAEEERARYLWRISLRNYNDILASLKLLKLTE